MSAVQWLLAYLLGLFTLPAALAVGAFLLWSSLPDASDQADSKQAPVSRAQKLERRYAKQKSRKSNTRSGEVETDGQACASPYGAKRTGWLRITRSLGAPPPETADTNAKLTDLVARGFAKWMNNRRNNTKKTVADGQAGSTPVASTESGQDMYYAVLVGDTLVMYDSEAMNECRGVIIMSKHRVSLHHNPDVSESQVYSRRTPIKLSPLNEGVEAVLYKRQVPDYYIYADKPVDKEDWYFALSWSSLASASLESSSGDDEKGNDSHGAVDELDSGSSHLETEDVRAPGGESAAQSAQLAGSRGGDATTETKPRLTKARREQLLMRMRRSCFIPDQPGIRSVFDTISARGAQAGPGKVREDEWLNAMVGRIFLAMYRTEFLRQHFIRKLQSKFDRVQRPIFLDRMVVSDLDVGDNAPVITNTKLESFDANGQIDASMYMHYVGGFKVVLKTNVKLGSLRLSIALSVVLESLAGKMLVRFRPAPSNRVWVGFYEMPQMRLKLSPVFMQKQVKYAVISQAIEKQIYDILRISMVLPNMDDTVFFPTPHEDGGILERSLKDYNDADLDDDAVSEVDNGDGDGNSQSEATAPTASDRSSSTVTQTGRIGSTHPANGNDYIANRKENTSVIPAAGSDRQSMVETLQSQPKQRPLSFSLADASSGIVDPSESASIKSDFPHVRRDSIGSIGSNISGNQEVTVQHDPLAIRKQMVTPSQLNNETTANSSSESLERYRQQLRENREKLRTGDIETTARSLSPAPSASAASIKSSISASAASFFKRAKDSQAAESAKTWWQSMQKSNTSVSMDVATSELMSERASAFQPNTKQQQQSTENILLDSNQPVPPRLPPRATDKPDSSRQTASRETESGVSDNSNRLLFPQLVLEPGSPNSGGGEYGSSGTASGSSIAYGGRAIMGSSVTGDSSLVRRRPAALDKGGEEMALPIHRRYSNSAKLGTAASAYSMGNSNSNSSPNNVDQ
ncbi:hypothetical protein LPJ72_000738 [Coemansia sp. Benny D160-2]|nr:hypothetical protein LPJ72_000738 [Coemansia sp. Benny D160-2]